MVMRRSIGAWTFAALVLVAGCSGSSDSDTSDPDETSSEQTNTGDEGNTGSADTSTSTVSGDDGTVPETTLRPGVVALDGSVEEILQQLDDATNFAAGVAGWLADVPGQEGVLRNSRGITLFVPVDDGFSADDRDVAFADPDTAALTLSDHLRVGVLEVLDEPVVVSSGLEYPITVDGDDTLIDGRRVIRTETASNGVIHLVAGPLGGDG